MNRSLAALVWAALRRRPFSFIATAILVTTTAALAGVAVPLALTAWLCVGFILIGGLSVAEPFVLERLGCRAPTAAEADLLAPAQALIRGRVLVVNDETPWIGCGLRSIVISRATLDVLDDQSLIGLVWQTAMRLRAACLAREALVWIGNASVLGIWHVARGLALFGRVLALVIGDVLVVPLLMWPNAYVEWAGRILGGIVVGFFGAVLLSGGMAALGLGLLLGWAVVAGLSALLGWEARRAELEADRATVKAGLGAHLREALETFAWLNAPHKPAGWFALLVRAGAPLEQRIERLTSMLNET